MLRLFNRILMVFAIYCISGTVIAESTPEKPEESEESYEVSDFYAYFTYAEGGLIEDSWVAEISLSGQRKGTPMEYKLSLSILKAEDLHYGVDLAGRYFLSKKMPVYIGAGLFAGELFVCGRRDLDNECVDDGVIALYPEFGLAITFEDVRLVFFNRRYHRFKSTLDYSEHNMVGFSIGLQF